MAKKETKEAADNSKRQSRKEILRARKQEQQQRNILIAAGIVGLIIVLVIIVAVVNELFIAPNRAVATVEGQNISLNDWQDRVEFERAQRIINLEEQLASFNNDVGLVQQFSSQSIIELISENSEAFGEGILEQMVDEELIHQGAEERGLVPTDGDIDERLGSVFNYFGGESPTPLPEPTETIVPTPSLTPIGFDGEPDADSGQTEQDVGEAPTSAPLPTATPVSEEAFQTEFNDLIGQYKALGVSGDTYRTLISSAIMAERMMDALAEEQTLPTEDIHASFFYILTSDEEEANQIVGDIDNGDFLTAWNTVRSQPADASVVDAPTASASEILWQTRDWLEGSFGVEIAQEVFDLPLDSPSDIITISGSDGSPLYLIIMVSGREMRPLSEAELQSRKEQLLQDFVAEGRLGDIEISELWRSRVPTAPILDPKFRQPPTPTPPAAIIPDEAPSEGTGE